MYLHLCASTYIRHLSMDTFVELPICRGSNVYIIACAAHYTLHQRLGNYNVANLMCDTCTHAHAHTHTHAHTCMHACTQLHTHTHAHIHPRTHKHTHIYTQYGYTHYVIILILFSQKAFVIQRFNWTMKQIDEVH